MQKRKLISPGRKSMRRRLQLRILDLKGQVPFAKDYDYKPLRQRRKPA